MFKCAVNSWILVVFAAQLGFPLISGKNLALRGNTKQSSTYFGDAVPAGSSNAVDGDKSGDFTKGGCSCTNPGDPKPNLKLTFGNPVTIKTVFLYNRLQDGTNNLRRLKGFILRGFSSDNRELFTFTDRNPVAQLVYTVQLDNPVSGVAMVNVEATSTEADGFKMLTLCELEVFGVDGTNLALRGNTWQSSTYTGDGILAKSSNAVDGDKSGDFTKGGCSCTYPMDPKPNLNLTFENPVTVKTFVLYNRFDGESSELLSRLQGFILRSFSGDNRELFKFTDTNPVAQHVYTVHPVKPVSGVVIVNVEATSKDRNGLTILTLCELEVFGE